MDFDLDIILHFLFTAFKIHISQDTKDCLDRVGGFIVKLRGELEIKVSHTDVVNR